MKINQLLAGITKTDIELAITGLCLNAAHIQAGDVFVALQGKSTHGANYIKQAIDRGCIAVLIEAKNVQCAVPIIVINKLSKHLKTLASRLYPNARKVELIGITGTNGKTSVGYFISQLLDQLGIKNGFIGTLGITNSQIISNRTTPDILTLYKILHHYHLNNINTAILEVSSHALEQDSVKGLNFKQAIFTNLTQDHLDYHQSMDNYQNAKCRLFAFDSLNSVVLNRDDKNHPHFLKTAANKPTVLYSTDDFSSISAKAFGFLLQLEQFVFEVNLLGQFNLSNLLAAFHSVCALGFEKETLIPLLSKLQAPLGRMQKIKNKLVWVDYAHTPDALGSAISTLKTHYPTHEIRVLFGCGGNRDKNKRVKMGAIASKLADTIILTNDNPRNEEPQSIIDDILAGIDEGFELDIILDRKLAIETAITTLNENECLLIAGKGHETTQQFKGKTIDLNDIEIAQNASQ